MVSIPTTTTGSDSPLFTRRQGENGEDEEETDEEEGVSRRGSSTNKGRSVQRRGSLKGSADLDAATSQLREEEPLIQVSPLLCV
jgi:hypothetical protein